jgi:hypothetical protein
MSWWVSLNDESGNPVQVSSFEEGGTYALGGSTKADLNITYNYSPFYYEHIDKDAGLRWLDGKVAKDTVAVLQIAVDALGSIRDEDYWKKTPGNAGYALSILLVWAMLYPDGVWRIS